MDKHSKIKIQKTNFTAVLATVLFSLFVLLSSVIANRVYKTTNRNVINIIESRVTARKEAVKTQFFSAINATESLSAGVSAIFEADQKEWEPILNELLANTVKRGQFDSVWAVFEPEVFGEKFAISYVENDRGHIQREDVEDIDGQWYYDGLAASNTTLSEDVELDTIDNKEVLITSTYSQVLKDSRVAGVAGVDIKLVGLSTDLKGESIYKNAKASLVNSVGTIIATDNPDYSIDTEHPLFESDEKTLFNRKEDEGILSVKKNGKLITVLPFSYDRTGKCWNIIVETPLTSVNASTVELLAFIIIGFVLYLTVLAFGAGIIIKHEIASRKQKRLLGKNLATEIQNLAVSAKETAAVSQDQNAAVKEIVATMEDADMLSKNISSKIEDVSAVAGKTTADAEESTVSLNLNLQKLEEISRANDSTIEGIKELSSEVDNVWDIVSLITNVADQSKIIAFNAELEAASAGEAGKNFHIVASEIRRLADGILSSTKEIKERISGIQHSSDSLILLSESGTAKVNEGKEAAKELEEKFNNIKKAAAITEDSAREISTIIQQQCASTSQILTALKQISAGVDNFSSEAERISSTSENLKGISQKLISGTDSKQSN